MEKVFIYTDGSCINNPGPGGWAAILFIAEEKIEISGAEKDTTNNRMEMSAIINALKYLHNHFSKEELFDLSIKIHSDSNLIIQTLNSGWKKKKNTDLWAEIDKLRAFLNIEWIWVKAHADNTYNNEVDKLAFKAAKSQ